MYFGPYRSTFGAGGGRGTAPGHTCMYFGPYRSTFGGAAGAADKRRISGVTQYLRMPKRSGAGIALLADPTRRQIITFLAQHPRRPKGLAKELGLSFSSVSEHLALLCEAGLVRRMATPADGRGVLYLLAADAQGRIIAWLAGTEVGIEHGRRRSGEV